MARILINELWYEQVEPCSFGETEFEDRIVLHAPSVYAEYYVLPFKQTVEASMGKARADLIFISRNYDDWRVVEVEMGYHSFDDHVEPQVEKLANAQYGKPQAKYLFDKYNYLDLDKLTTLISNTQPQIIVIVNEPKPDWIKRLTRHNAIIAVFELFRAEDDKEIFRVNGEYPTLISDNICACSFHPIIPRYLQIHEPNLLNFPLGMKIKLRYNNCITEWIRVDADGKVWLQPAGRNPLNPKLNYQLYRQSDKTLVLRSSKK
jgi:hypothetical protein